MSQEAQTTELSFDTFNRKSTELLFGQQVVKYPFGVCTKSVFSPPLELAPPVFIAGRANREFEPGSSLGHSKPELFPEDNFESLFS